MPILQAAWLIPLALCAGCASYQLRGTVVDGTDPAIRMSTPAILVVSANDPRLKSPGLVGANIQLTLDPETLKPINAGNTASDPSGRFALPVGHNAGFLLYDAYILARRGNHLTAETIAPLPRGNQRLLIILPPGKDAWQPKTDFVDETIEMSKPYMEGGR